MNIGYELSVGGQSASSGAPGGGLQLLSLVSLLDMDGVGGRCVMEFSSQAGGSTAPGDEVQVEIDGGEGLARVFTGEVNSVTHSPCSTRITATDDLAKLARMETEAGYEGLSAGGIVKELLSQGGAREGEVMDGPDFPYYYLHKGPRALAHIRSLARLCGADVYTNGKGEVQFAEPRQGAPDFIFQFGKELLDLVLTHSPPVFDGVVVYGEGAAGAHGADKAHWLAAELEGVKSQASVGVGGAVVPGNAGKNPRLRKHGGLRTMDDTRSAATGQARAAASRPLKGALRLLGEPKIEPGALVGVTGLERDRWGEAADLLSMQPLRVRQVKHMLSIETGFTTRLEF